MSILGAIANPRTADIGKALDMREQRLARDKQERDRIRMGQLVAEATPGLREGTPLYEVATKDPEGYAMYAKLFGVPLNSGERMQQFADDVKTMNALAQSDPDQAYLYAKQTAEQRKQQGIDSPMLEKWKLAYETDPIAATTSAIALNRQINGEQSGRPQSSENLPGGYTKIVTDDGGIQLKDVANRIIEGDEAVRVYREAEKLGINQEREKYAARQEGTLNTKLDLEPTLTDLNARAGEGGKLDVQLEMLPQIQSAIKSAEMEAASRGEAISEYDRAKSAMPGLNEVFGKLMTLSDVATYTMGGKAFDTVSKELGFGATEGSTARAKMESMVDNQVLPLLRDTFGAQFTVEEGNRLRKTMLDIDAAPDQKKAILQSFMEQKMRDLEMKRGRVDAGVQQQTEPKASASLSQSKAVNWSDL